MDQLRDALSHQWSKETEGKRKRIRDLEFERCRMETEVLPRIVEKFTEIELFFCEMHELVNKFHERQKRDLA